MRGTTLILHEFKLGDVDDVELYVAHPIYAWQQTEKGKWCMENAYDLTWHTMLDEHSLGYRITITGKLTEKNLTYYMLQWGIKGCRR